MSLIDGDHWHMPPVRKEDAEALRTAAREHREAMAPCSREQRERILMELRLVTMQQDASPAQQRAIFSKLMQDLADVPEDILRAGVKAYINDPSDNTRFFPRSAGEVRKFTSPLAMQRARRSVRLKLMAEAAADIFDSADKCTPEQAAQIMEEFGLRSASAPAARPTGPARTPTREDYIALGVDPATLDQLEEEKKNARP